jgi:hypothetical protein
MSQMTMTKGTRRGAFIQYRRVTSLKSGWTETMTSAGFSAKSRAMRWRTHGQNR